jgi:NAD(P)-dependent dehydrogenase (short-subunit alcohol dehydrogenase family)
VLGVIADVTVGEQLDAAFGEVTSAIDRRDIVVNNVGGTLNLVRPFTDTTTVHWELLYRLNLYHIMAMSRKALPLMGRAEASSMYLLWRLIAATPSERCIRGSRLP